MHIRWPAADFRECVVYTPPHREAICIEPLTCAAGAAALAQRGIDAGWRVLPPAEKFATWTEIVTS
jgi:aldose 1-epimerase